ncbi:MAG: signal peptidase I [Butyrivibrio sp.]|nr:signal peptidase I [Butyrivibrio sp.]
MNEKLKEVLKFVIELAIIYVLTMLFITYVMQRTVVSGESMMNTLQDGDSLLVDKISYNFKEPERFDIVIFPYQGDPDECFIKRIIGLPGETVQIDFDGNIYIDGEILEENYGAEVIIDPGRAYEPVTLGEDEYFVMGDNRNHSMDSREPSVGNISKDDIIGRAFVRIMPFSSFGVLE